MRNILKKNKDFEVNDFKGQYSVITGDKISVTFGSFLLDGDWPQLKVNKLYCGFDMTLWVQLVAGCHFYFNCSLDSLVSLCASKTNGLNPNRTWKQLTFPL